MEEEEEGECDDDGGGGGGVDDDDDDVDDDVKRLRMTLKNMKMSCSYRMKLPDARVWAHKN